jgi:hypothetical protein
VCRSNNPGRRRAPWASIKVAPEGAVEDPTGRIERMIPLSTVTSTLSPEVARVALEIKIVLMVRKVSSE